MTNSSLDETLAQAEAMGLELSEDGKSWIPIKASDANLSTENRTELVMDYELMKERNYQLLNYFGLFLLILSSFCYLAHNLAIAKDGESWDAFLFHIFLTGFLSFSVIFLIVVNISYILSNLSAQTSEHDYFWAKCKIVVVSFILLGVWTYNSCFFFTSNTC